MIAFACKKKTTEDATPAPNNPSTPVNNNPFFSGNFNGSALSIAEESDDNAYGYSASMDYDNDHMDINYYGAFDKFGTDIWTPEISVAVGISGFSHPITGYGFDFFQNAIATAPVAFYANGSSAIGYDFSYADNQGNYWSSSYGDQTGSTITITTNEAASTVMNKARRLLKGNVSCKLYNDQTGDVMTLTNGSFKVYLHSYEM